MSASREKKQRVSTGPSAKAAKVTKEQVEYQRKARRYTIIGIVVVLLVAVLLVMGSNPVQGSKTAATVGSEKLSVAELGYYYYQTRYPYAVYGLLDTSKSDDAQAYGEGTFRDYFMEAALANAQDITAVYDAAVKAGYKDSDVAEDVAASIENAKASAASSGVSYKTYLKGMYGSYMTPSIMKDIMTKTLLANKYYADEYNKTLESYTNEDFEKYYAEHADDLDEFEYSYLQFKPETVATKDADGKELSEDEVAKLTEEANAAAKAKAEAVLAAYNDGKTNIADLIDEYYPTTSGDHTVTQGTGSINSYYKEDLLKLGEGEAALVEDETVGYYVIVFHSRGRNETLTANVRHILFSAEPTVGSDNKVTAPSEKLMSEAEKKANDALAEYLAGSKTAESFGELANKYSDDTGSNTTGGLYENVTENYFVSELNEWMFGENQPAVGDTAVIRHDGDTASTSTYWGYHVIRLDSWGMAHWALDAREALAGEAMESLRTSLGENFKPVLTAGADSIGK